MTRKKPVVNIRDEDYYYEANPVIQPPLLYRS